MLLFLFNVKYNVIYFLSAYLNTEADAAHLHETVDLVKSQPVIVVACL